MKIGLIGFGGYAKEIACCLNVPFKYFVSNYLYEKMKSNNIKLNDDILPISKYNNSYKAIITVGDPIKRKEILKEMPNNVEFTNFIHPSAQLLDKNIKLGHGTIICANSILTTSIEIGNHSHINLCSTIGHDCVIGNFFTTAPGVNISGNCNIGDFVYFGTNSVVREKINICNNVTIGLNSGVVSNITESGIYVGTPAKKIK